MKKMPLLFALACFGCTPALVAFGVTVGAAGGYISASVVHDNRTPAPVVVDAGVSDAR